MAKKALTRSTPPSVIRRGQVTISGTGHDFQDRSRIPAILYRPPPLSAGDHDRSAPKAHMHWKDVGESGGAGRKGVGGGGPQSPLPGTGQKPRPGQVTEFFLPSPRPRPRDSASCTPILL